MLRTARFPTVCYAAILPLVLSGAAWGAKTDGVLEVVVVDGQSQQPIAARIELRNQRGRAVRVRPEGAVVTGNSIAFDGTVRLELARGEYDFLIDAGPEYQTRPGHFTLDRHADDSTRVELNRRVDMEAAGWWAGDLDAQLPSEDLPLAMRAAGIDFAAPLVIDNDAGKCRELVKRFPSQQPAALVDRRRGGGLLLVHDQFVPESFDLCAATADSSTLAVSRTAGEHAFNVIALTPFAWDLPLWLASGKLDAIQIIHRHALADGVVDNEAGGRTRDKIFFPGKTGNGRWSETIYHHVLNCGLRIPPAAGSGTGSNDNPLGTNRTYVYCGEEFSPSEWLRGLRGGEVVVSNGPLLQTIVEGRPPGWIFEMPPGTKRTFQIGLSLSFYEKARVEYLEIVKNGQVVHEVRLADLAQSAGRLPPLEFTESGWFLVRAMTTNSSTYQYASTGPYYVEAGSRPRVSRASVQFFLDWLDAATTQFADEPTMLRDIAAARPFWEGLLGETNAE